MMSDVTIVEFLRARLDDDEAGVRPYVNEGGECRPWRADEVGGTVRVPPVLSGDDGVIARAATHIDAVHIARHDPARVLREVEAKRQVLHEFVTFSAASEDMEPTNHEELSVRLAGIGIRQGLSRACAHLAAVYSDHPDYRDEWKP